MANEKKLIYADDARRAILQEDPKLAYCIDKIKAVDAVSRGVHYQVRWERDVAMGQLEEHGISFGCIAPDVVKVVRCKDCKYREVTPDSLRWCNVWNGINGMGDEGFCNYGERKDNVSSDEKR